MRRIRVKIKYKRNFKLQILKGVPTLKQIIFFWFFFLEDEVSVPKKQKLAKKELKPTKYNASNFDNKENLTKINSSSLFQASNFNKYDMKPWNDAQLLAELQQIDCYTSANIIKSFNDDHTIPFMCRYRRELIGDLSPDQ